MDTTHICKDCGKEFVITQSEMDFFKRVAERENRECTPPKRCKDCRIKKRERNEKQKIEKEHNGNNWSSDRDLV